MPPHLTPGWRLRFTGALVMTMTVAPLTVYSVTALAPLLVTDLGLSRTQLGMSATLSFSVAAVLSQAGGRCVARLGTRAVAHLLCGIALVAMLLVATAESYAWLLAGVALSGVAQALSLPVTNQLVAEHLPPGERGLITGAKQGGVQVSQLLAGATLPALAVTTGWRGAVIALGGVVVVSTLVLIHRHVPADGSHAPQRRPARPDGSPVRWLLPYAFFMGAGLQGVNVYVPLFAHEALGLSVTSSGLAVAAMGGLGFLARVLWGRLCESVTTTPRGPLAGMAFCGAAATALLAAAGARQDARLLWAGVTVYACTAVAANVLVMLTLVSSDDQSGVGRATGVVGVGQFLGFAAGPVGFGLVVDRTGDYVIGWSATTALHVVAGVIMTAWAVAATVRGRSRRHG